MEKQIKIGDTFITNEGYNLTVSCYIDTNNVYVKFDDGQEINVYLHNLINGRVKNKNKKAVFGVGYYGYGKYVQNEHKKALQVWKNMLRRCYQTDLVKEQTYIDCFVCDEWHNFQKFTEWFYENYIVGCQIDKDLLTKGNKIYSPENCCFIPAELNNLVSPKVIKENGLPIGVVKHGKKFRSQCLIETGEKIYQSFDTVDEASEFYKTTKESCVKRFSEIYKHLLPEKTYIALQKWSV